MQKNWFMSGAVVNNNLYFMTEVYGCFMRIDLETCESYYLPLEKQIKYSQSAIVYAEEEYVYAVTNGGEYLLKYSIDKEECKYFYLGLQSENLHGVASIAKFGKELIIVPIYSSSIIRIDTDSGKMKKDVIHGAVKNEGKPLFARCNVIDENQMWLFFNGTKEVVQYNLSTGKKLESPFPDQIKAISDVELWEGQFYILDITGNLFRWSPGQPAEKLFENPHGDKIRDFALFHIAGSRIWLMPSTAGKEIISLDIGTGKYQIQESYPEDFKYTAPEIMGKYTQKIQTDQYCYFSMHAGNYIFYVNQKTGIGNWLNVIWPDEDEKLNYLSNRKNIIIREKMIGLRTFASGIQNKNCVPTENGSGSGSYIWDYVSKK